MRRRKGQEGLSVVQAVDHLSSMAEIDAYAPLNEPPPSKKRIQALNAG